MSRRRMDPIARIQKHFHFLTDPADRLWRLEPGIYNEFGEHTLLKLISLRYMQEIYANILKGRKGAPGFKKLYYLDLMAGSGVTHLKYRDSFAMGSATMAATISKDFGGVFDRIYCVEIDDDKRAALDKRLASILDETRFKTCHMRAEEAIMPIAMKVQRESAHFLAFVDYQNMQGPGFDDIAALLRLRGDVVITFQPSTVQRVACLAKSDPLSGFVENIQRYWGKEDGSWKVCETQEALLERYVQKLEEFGRVVKRIYVRSDLNAFWYVTLFTSKRTSGHNPFMNALDELNELFDNNQGLLKGVIDIEEGRTTGLDCFC